MTVTGGSGSGTSETTRRDLLKKGAVGGAVAWVAPTVLSVQGAAAQSGGVIVPPAPPTGSVYVYIGPAPFFGGIGFSQFASAVGRPLVANQSSLPANYSNVAVVLIADNTTPPSGPDAAALLAYLQAGGRVIVQTDANGFSSLNSAAAAWIAALGGSTTYVSGAFDSGCGFVATSITAHPRTAGVSTIGYAYTGDLAPNGAQVLATGVSGQVLVTLQQIGAGLLVVTADVNLFGDGCGQYAGNGNGQLANNLLA